MVIKDSGRVQDEEISEYCCAQRGAENPLLKGKIGIMGGMWASLTELGLELCKMGLNSVAEYSYNDEGVLNGEGDD